MQWSGANLKKTDPLTMIVLQEIIDWNIVQIKHELLP